MEFSGNVVLVAGGTGGLGRAVSLAFLQERAKVVVTYRDEKEFAALRSAAGDKMPLLEGRETDVTDENSVAELVTGIVASHRRLDAMVNAVGAYAGGPKLWDADLKTFDRMLALNLRSGLLLSRAVIPVMLKIGHGAVVNVASKAAVDPASGNSAYSVSKAAAVALMDSLARDLKGTGIRVNSILPSVIDTEANRSSMPESDFRAWPKPEDIARVILFLCSEDSKVIHGAAIPVYGNG